MVNISKTKRNFIALNTLFAILSGAAGAVILHIALPGHYFGGYRLYRYISISSVCLVFICSMRVGGMLRRSCRCCIWQ